MAEVVQITQRAHSRFAGPEEHLRHLHVGLSVGAAHFVLEESGGLGRVPREQLGRHDLGVHRILQRVLAKHVRQCRQDTQRRLIADAFRMHVAQVRSDRLRHALRRVVLVPVPQAVSEHIDAGIDCDPLHVDRVGVCDQQQLVLARRCADARERFLAHQWPVRGRTESVLDEDLHAARAALRDSLDDCFRRVLGLVRAGRQRMLLRVRGLVHVVLENLVTHGLRNEDERITVDHRNCATVKQVRPHRLAFESLQAGRERGETEHLRDAEIQIAAWLLAEVLVAQWLERRIVARRWDAGGIADVHMRVHDARRQELAAAVDLARICLGRDALLTDADDAPIANQHVPFRERLRLLRRNHRDVLDQQVRSRRRTHACDEQKQEQVPG